MNRISAYWYLTLLL